MARFLCIHHIQALARRMAPGLGALIFCAAAPVFALDTEVRMISDDTSLRARLAESTFIEPAVTILRERPYIERLESGDRVQIRLEREAGNNEFTVILARELNGAFPGWAQGSFILTRHIATGAALRVRIFLRSDPYTYIQFRPLNSEKSEMDVVAYDAFLARSLPVPFSFKRLLVTPLQEILDAVGPKFPERYFNPHPEDYRTKQALITEIRRKIHALRYEDDGAFDENGTCVFIENLTPQNPGSDGLNCSGFAKWVIDGMLRPVTGLRLPITPLKQPYGKRGTNFTDPYERIRDPYFGLDWIRNLAAAAGTTIKSAQFATLEEIEVQKVPFQLILTRAGKTSTATYYPGHQENAGFGIEAIQSILYTLAIDEPDMLFLGAVNTEGGVPRMRTYFHVVVLIPYFDEQKVFHVALFESAEETSFTRFRSRYPAHHINLCRVPATMRFDP